MLSKIRQAARKPIRLAAIIPLAAALLIVASPGSALGSAATATQGNATAQQQPDATCPAGGQCFADVADTNTFYDFINRIYQEDLVTGYPCGGTGEPCDSENRPYYRPGAIVSRGQMAKFIDNARHLSQINIEVASGDPPISVRNTADTALAVRSTSGQALSVQSQSSVAIYAQTGNATAVYGFSTGGSDGIGVSGYGPTGVKGHGTGSGPGVSGESGTGYGLVGAAETGTGMLGVAGTSGNAGNFIGDISVTGNCAGCFGPSKVDHPLDPANKYLYQSPVQSDDMMNVYNGNVTLDAKGEAIVQMPAYFEALNKDFRYQLTAIGAPGPNLYVASRVENNTFKIAGGAPGTEVSWQVTGVRQDAFANAHRVAAEQDKPEAERGKYLHPTEQGQPESLGVNYDTIQQYRPQSDKP